MTDPTNSADLSANESVHTLAIAINEFVDTDSTIVTDHSAATKDSAAAKDSVTAKDPVATNDSVSAGFTVATKDSIDADFALATNDSVSAGFIVATKDSIDAGFTVTTKDSIDADFTLATNESIGTGSRLGSTVLGTVAGPDSPDCMAETVVKACVAMLLFSPLVVLICLTLTDSSAEVAQPRTALRYMTATELLQSKSLMESPP